MDVSKDQAALKEMVATTGQYGVPVIRVGDKAMVGWDKSEFEGLVRE
jgi:glutaredoxin